MLPEYDDEKIEEYFSKVDELISKLGWSLDPTCMIGLFSFSKINMH